MCVDECVCQVMQCRTNTGWGKCLALGGILLWDQEKTSVKTTEPADVSASQGAHGSMAGARLCVYVCVRAVGMGLSPTSLM